MFLQFYELFTAYLNKYFYNFGNRRIQRGTLYLLHNMIHANMYRFEGCTCMWYLQMFSVEATTPAVRSRLLPLMPAPSLLVGDHQLTREPNTGTCLRIPSCHSFSSFSRCKSSVAASIPDHADIMLEGLFYPWIQDHN